MVKIAASAVFVTFFFTMASVFAFEQTDNTARNGGGKKVIGERAAWARKGTMGKEGTREIRVKAKAGQAGQMPAWIAAWAA